MFRYSMIILLLSSMTTYAAELKSMGIIQSDWVVSATSLQLAAAPEQVGVVMGKETVAVKRFQMQPIKLLLIIDTSATCLASGIQLHIRPHLSELIKRLPPGSEVTLVTFNSMQGVQVAKLAALAQLNSALVCQDVASLPVKSALAPLLPAKEIYDAMLIYSSGNLGLDGADLEGFNSLAKTRAMVSYMPWQDNKLAESGILLLPFMQAQSPHEWLQQISSSLSRAILQSARLYLPATALIGRGKRDLQVEFISAQGEVLDKATITMPASSFWLTLMQSRNLRLLCLMGLMALTFLAVNYYRTPRCRHCRRPILRRYRHCLFCLKPGEIILQLQDAGGTHLKLCPYRYIVSAQRGADYRLKHSSKAFALERQGKQLWLKPNLNGVILNQDEIKQPRLLKHQDIIAVEGVTCKIYCKN